MRERQPAYWDSFSISVTNLPYDVLKLDDDPLAFPFVWGGSSYNDGNLERLTEDDRTITFAGNGETKMYLNLVLDTANHPDHDGLYPSWGTFSIPPIALTAYRPMGIAGIYNPFPKTPVSECDEEDPNLGPGIRINGNDDRRRGR